MNTRSVELSDPTATATQILAWQDDNEPEYDLHLEQFEAALKGLPASRKDERANWARPQIKDAIDALIAARSAKNAAEIEIAREAYRKALADCAAARKEVEIVKRAAASKAVESVADLETINRAKLRVEIADMRAVAAREAFAAAVQKNRLPSVGSITPLADSVKHYFLAQGTKDLREVAFSLGAYEFGRSNAAADEAFQQRTTEPNQMVFEICAEHAHTSSRIQKLAYRLRWFHFATLHHLPCEDLDLATELAALGDQLAAE